MAEATRGDEPSGDPCAEPGAHPAAGQSLAVQAAFERLRAQFVAGLAQRWHEIAAAPSAPAQEAALHRLAGAAGSYGLGALCAAARQAEQHCRSEPLPTTHPRLQSVRQHIEAAGVTLP